MQNQETTGKLQEVSYSNSGDSLGNLYSITTAEGADGALIVIEREARMHSIPITVREYRAPADLLERIKGIADTAGMKDWGDLPASDLFPLDAPTPTITLAYASDDPDDPFPEWVSFTRWDELPEGGEEAFGTVRDELLACVSEENLIREYEEELRN